MFSELLEKADWNQNVKVIAPDYVPENIKLILTDEYFN